MVAAKPSLQAYEEAGYIATSVRKQLALLLS